MLEQILRDDLLEAEEEFPWGRKPGEAGTGAAVSLSSNLTKKLLDILSSETDTVTALLAEAEASKSSPG